MDDARNSQITQRGCSHPGPGDMVLANAGLDAFELAVLEVSRLMLAYARGHRPRYAPDLAQVSRNLFGADRGDMVLGAVTALVQTAALSRAEPLRHANPFCPGCSTVLTAEEGQLLRSLHHLRRGHMGQATIQALLLCEARPVAALIEAAGEVASLGPQPG